MSALPFQGGVIFRTFAPDSGFGTYANVDRHGHFTLKQLRLPVLNETHTNIYTGPRLNALLLLRRTLFPFCHDPYPRVKGIRNIFEINQKLFC
jgi:hypothetical protein